eukprot:306381-Chlamydomonas_euryale.AAC.5
MLASVHARRSNLSPLRRRCVHCRPCQTVQGRHRGLHDEGSADIASRLVKHASDQASGAKQVSP